MLSVEAARVDRVYTASMVNVAVGSRMTRRQGRVGQSSRSGCPARLEASDEVVIIVQASPVQATLAAGWSLSWLVCRPSFWSTLRSLFMVRQRTEVAMGFVTYEDHKRCTVS